MSTPGQDVPVQLFGIGYDSHRLAAGERLVLGGIQFEYELGLLGHSDADVLAHAITDALLGAAGRGDIGQRFPDSDQRWAGADSMQLLETVVAELRADGFQPVNMDCTLVMERPKLGSRRDEMRQRLARALGLPPERVNVKASTGEGIGFVGRQEGVAALACVGLLQQQIESV